MPTMGTQKSSISVRLDGQALRALRAMTRAGMSTSEAVRQALIEAAGRRGRRRSLTAEAARLAQDSEDRAEMAEVAALMESLRESR